MIPILESFNFETVQQLTVFSELFSMPDVFGASRLNYGITVIILVALVWSMIVRGLFQDPMERTFADYLEGTFNRYCSVESFFNLKRKVTLVENVSGVEGSAAKADISLRIFNYYQLGFITLLLQAMLFYIPYYLWPLLPTKTAARRTSNRWSSIFVNIFIDITIMHTVICFEIIEPFWAWGTIAAVEYLHIVSKEVPG